MSDKEKNQITVKASRLYGDYLIMLLAPLLLAVYHYGARALAVIAAGVVSAMAADLLLCFLLKKKFLLRDLSNVFTGAAIALMMPAGIPLYVPASAAFFAVAVVKVPFGGSLRAPFVPAAAGFAFATVCFKEQIFDYSYNSADKLFGQRSLGALLAQGNAVHPDAINTLDILSGNVAGPMGTGCALLMLACCAVLIIRRKAVFFTAGGFVSACALYAALFPRVNASPLASVFFELSAGSLLFAAVFFLTDYATQPRSVATKIASGAMCGIFCMMMRTVGTYEETVCFAVLLANGFAPVINSGMTRISNALGRRSSSK